MLYFEKVSVKEAIRAGHMRADVPALIICVASIAAYIGLLLFTTTVFRVMPWIIFIGFLLAFLYRAYTLPKWQLWAFENVRNVHEMKDGAITERLMVNRLDGKFGAWQITTALQREKWQQLQEKFKRPDVFEDDLGVPAQVIVYYSLIKKTVWLVMWLFIFACGLALAFDPKSNILNYIFAGFMILLGAGLFYITIKQAFDRSPRFVIGNDGITTAEGNLYSWKRITNETTMIVGSGKAATSYLSYNMDGRNIRIQLDDFSVTRMQLAYLLRVYRGRFEQRIDK